jgi:hypothetical protein
MVSNHSLILVSYIFWLGVYLPQVASPNFTGEMPKDQKSLGDEYRDEAWETLKLGNSASQRKDLDPC